MAPLDWLIVVAYVVLTLVIGMVFTGKASKSTADFFVAGRTLSWFAAGTSMVAGTFSADTPLFVAGLARREGISANWFWWAMAFGALASVFFFSRLWRRTEAETDIEFLVRRYDRTRATNVLRIFRSLYGGVLLNCVVIASVTLALAKTLAAVLSLSPVPIFTIPWFGGVTSTALLMLLLGASATAYSVMSGLYGVVYTDVLQFALAMAGAITLAVIVWVDASAVAARHGHTVVEAIRSTPGMKSSSLDFFPDLSDKLAVFTFLVYVTVGWWDRAPGNGQLVQRLLATRSERHAFFAFLWFCVCHFVIRPWPWILVGIASVLYFPVLKDAEGAYPLMIGHFLPVGLKGLMVASLLAAFMSTIDTQLNWGASYLVNDLYRAYLRPGRSTTHYVLVSRLTMAGLVMTALIVATRLTSILDAYKYIGVMESGIGLVLILRWYWWRVTPWSEISALGTSVVLANALALYPATAGGALFPLRVLITLVVTSAVWITVTLLTSHEPSAGAVAFYRKMRIRGPGWARVAAATGVTPRQERLGDLLVAWAASLALLFCLLFGIGSAFLHGATETAAWAVGAVVSFFFLRRVLPKIHLTDVTTAVRGGRVVPEPVSSEVTSLSDERRPPRDDAR